MDIEETPIAGLLTVTPKRHGNERGLFVETFKAEVLAKVGVTAPFIQDNLARSGPRGVVRGLHFQTATYAQDKLIRCTKGAIYDVAIDIRPGSPTYGRSFGIKLSAENWKQLFVPKGFAHTYYTLTDDAKSPISLLRLTLLTTKAACSGTSRRWASAGPIAPA